jgi:hypothetical protein
VRSADRREIEPQAPFHRVRCRGDVRLRAEAMPSGGAVWLVARFADRTERLPFGGWRRLTVEQPVGPRRPARPLL